MNIENFVSQVAFEAVKSLYGDVDLKLIQVSPTRKEFTGDFTLVTFPLLKTTRKSPEVSANEIGAKIIEMDSHFESFNVIKGFLNLKLNDSFWIERFADIVANDKFGFVEKSDKNIMVEYSSPNTNKPLHLGHIRNNLLGYSVSKILEAAGNNVKKVNLVNDRGIHICKSMIAWQMFGEGETPESSGMKGDHLVGKYYVLFDKAYKAQIAELMEKGEDKDSAAKNAPIMQAASAMLRKWEAKDEEVYNLWQTMNGWVYEGFDKTYAAMGVSFDKIYYESQTYLLGKSLVEDGLERGVFYRREDNSVWIDLTADGLDEKLLLRGDGTSVYMTQDLGTALERHKEFNADNMIYVVGNEQNYHFQVLKLILSKLGYSWADHIYHLSYGMVELPEGKMKSREGTVVDADDLIEGMVDTAREMSNELGKLDGLSIEDADNIVTMIGTGALKYFILKVDPRKTMLFDPKESIDFNGNTAPFIQYTHARIKSVLRRATESGVDYSGAIEMDSTLAEKEISLIKRLYDFKRTLQEAADNMSPAIIAAFCYDAAKEFNQYYHDFPFLKEEDSKIRANRLRIANECAKVVANGMSLLGISVPERM
ncbi:MAG: arginine--tRNA ligase [Rikenellaceae bacterium]